MKRDMAEKVQGSSHGTYSSTKSYSKHALYHVLEGGQDLHMLSYCDLVFRKGIGAEESTLTSCHDSFDLSFNARGVDDACVSLDVLGTSSVVNV
ncbi:MAG: hypothetical protein M1834_003153 [Cirrosporium novae-zelandiae]|nr:MAG: hypothetical protein M1834_003153 [Cirrosporium novae-zelandiae]